MKNLLLIFSFIYVFSSANAQQVGLFSTNVSWNNSSGSQTRTTVVYVPTNYNQNYAYTLVIGLHGLGDNPSNYIQGISYFTLDSYFGNVILACPSEGTNNTSWFSGGEDFDILQSVISHLDGSYNIDLNKVFVQGFSFGGKSAYLHGLEEATFLRGIIASSPGFYNTDDIYNNCNDPLYCQFEYNYDNASEVLFCITAGSGEYNLGLTEPYLDLAQEAVVKLNASGGDAIFIEDPNGYHNLPPVSIVKECWDHITKPIASVYDLKNEKEINIFPNPANDIVYINLGDIKFSGKIELFSVIGKVLVINTFENEDIIVMDTHALQTGVYIVKISLDDKSVITRQLLIE